MSDKESIPFKILDDVTGDVKYAYAYNGNSARNFITRNRFIVTRLSIKEALSLKPEDILDATVEVHPDQAPLPPTGKPA